MKLFHFFHRLSEIKDNSHSNAEFFDYENISIKILGRRNTSYISLFCMHREVHICSFFYDKEINHFSFSRSNLTGNKSSIIEQDIDPNDFDEDENYLILKYGKIVESTKILSELETTMPRLYSFVSDAINQYDDLT